MVKEYLSREQVSFEDRDITSDPSAISELQKLGFMTTPVTVIGEKVIVGFDRQKLSEALIRRSPEPDRDDRPPE
jgi:glutaredoxin-like protein NrdH